MHYSSINVLQLDRELYRKAAPFKHSIYSFRSAADPIKASVKRICSIITGTDFFIFILPRPEKDLKLDGEDIFNSSVKKRERKLYGHVLRVNDKFGSCKWKDLQLPAHPYFDSRIFRFRYAVIVSSKWFFVTSSWERCSKQ